MYICNRKNGTGCILGDRYPWCGVVVSRCRGLSLQPIDLAVMSVTSLLANQSVASGSERACHDVISVNVWP